MSGEIISHGILIFQSLLAIVILIDELKLIKGKGMPFFKDAMSYGNLYIRFLVEFPKTGSITS